MIDKRTSDLVLCAAGLTLWAVGSKTFAERHADPGAWTTGSVETVAGLGLLVYGAYRMNETWGKGLGAVLGALVAYNAYQNKRGEELLPSFPLLPGHMAGAGGWATF